MKRNLTLTGMMGVGKSTIGRLLAKRLLMRFSDIDKIIENELEMSISKIFERKGESFFRNLEEKITLQEIRKKNTIISLGGGGFVNFKIRKNILLTTKSFWLDLNLRLLEKRLTKSKKRPLLNNKDLKITLKKIYNERKNTYSAANYRICCDKLNTNSIANKIIKIYAEN